MAKTEFLQIRLSPEDRDRLRRAAAAEYLDVSTWARRTILKALDEWHERQRLEGAEAAGEARRAMLPKDSKVAEPESDGRGKQKRK